ncbi:MAG: hypothetical protein JXA51_03120 [Dehalococcoidales bacterium]|nr:hypothetical protein [Dehalococcoidales bacterium]
MDKEYTFYDYIDADGDGSNVIKEWLNGEAKVAKAYFTQIISHLEVSSPPRTKDTLWKKPYAKYMKHEWAGFWELRKEYRNIQYRILGQMIHRNVYLVAYGIHKDQNFITDVTPQTASARVSQMKSNPTKYGRTHEYN